MVGPPPRDAQNCLSPRLLSVLLTFVKMVLGGVGVLRPQQLSTMNAILSKEDVLCIMSTGAGKSLCYQLPALLKDGFTLVHCPQQSPATHTGGIFEVVSPLISLMEDQVGALSKLGIHAALLSAATDKAEAAATSKAMTEGDGMRLLYVTPERLAKSKRFMARLEKANAAGRLSLIAIDEVHCCSQVHSSSSFPCSHPTAALVVQWGHDFRPDYKFLNVLRRQFPKVPILGLTATATEAIVDDVKDMLGLPAALVFRSGFNRTNLRFITSPCSTASTLGLWDTGTASGRSPRTRRPWWRTLRGSPWAASRTRAASSTSSAGRRPRRRPAP